MTNLYQDLILDHYHHPHCQGQLKHATHHAEGLNVSCGDRLQMDAAVENGILEKVRFEGSGCAISQASASILLDHLQGKPVEEIKRFTKDDLLSLLGIELTPARLKCALLSLETLQKTLEQMQKPD